MKRHLINIIFIIIPFLITGQEYLTGLNGNPVIKSHLKKSAENLNYKSQFLNYSAINLPFYDDFPVVSIYPDTSRWIGNEIFINSTFPLNPINQGVATFDVLDGNGNIYLEASPFPFMADRLISRPIRLDSVYDQNTQGLKKTVPGDSVYLSFYYQPQGLGDSPLWYDSLVLYFGKYNGDTVFSHLNYTWVYGYDYLAGEDEFVPPLFAIQPLLPCDTGLWHLLLDTLFYYDSLFIPCDSVFILDTDWEPVWSTQGDSIDVFAEKNDTYFKNVIIPITDTIWFSSDFQFMFANFGSLSVINSWQSNTDHWHIDMVYLNSNRTLNDVNRREAWFGGISAGFIKDYFSIPYNHYLGNITGLKKDSIKVFVSNLDSVSHLYNYNYYVQNEQGDTLPAFDYEGFTGYLEPLADLSIYDYQPFVSPPVTYYFASLPKDTLDFRISHVVYDQDSAEIGDTLVFVQQFRNYFSYDDGTAEAGYGLTPAGSMLAVRYKTEEEDTLRGLQMFFNKTLGEANNRLFHIAVWNDNNGVPGNLKYKLENVRPVFTDGLNEFSTYIFPDVVRLGVEVFFVGWIQTTNENLNIGYDRNNNSKSKNFYDVSGTWVNSSFEGSIMIRPVVGRSLLPDSAVVKSAPDKITISPNPPGDNSIVIGLPASCTDPLLRDYLTLRVIDLYGKVVFSCPYTESLQVSYLKQGIYFINLIDRANSRQYSEKLIILQ